MTKIIAIANHKGGVGKTTSSLNLAHALAIDGKTRVLLCAPHLSDRRFGPGPHRARDVASHRGGSSSCHDAERVARACHAMAAQIHRGGKLIVFGDGGATADAQHVAVEFVHPVIVGKRALPAISLTNDGARMSSVADSWSPMRPWRIRCAGWQRRMTSRWIFAQWG